MPIVKTILRDRLQVVDIFSLISALGALDEVRIVNEGGCSKAISSFGGLAILCALGKGDTLSIRYPRSMCSMKEHALHLALSETDGTTILHTYAEILFRLGRRINAA